MTVKRRFADIAEGQLLYREAGLDKPGTPLVMLPVAPGTSLGLEPLIDALAAGIA